MRAAEVPPLPAVLVRGSTTASYQTRWEELPAKRQANDAAASVWRSGSSLLRKSNRLRRSS